MKGAATSERVTNSVCRIDDWPRTARTNTLWQMITIEIRIISAATTPKTRDTP